MIAIIVVLKNKRFNAGKRIEFIESDTCGHGTRGCQMVYFETKNPILGNFKRAFDWKMLIYFMANWNILCTEIWDILSPFGTVCVHLEFFPVLVSCFKKNLATLSVTWMGECLRWVVFGKIQK
jgi:hypothetical protein